MEEKGDRAMVTVYGTDSCEDTRKSLRHLRRLGIPYDYRNVDLDPEALEQAKALNHGKRQTPVIQFKGEAALVEPTNLVLTDELIRHGIYEKYNGNGDRPEQNVGDLERGIRVASGLVGMMLASKLPGRQRLPLIALSGLEVYTGLTGRCPVYRALQVTSQGGVLDHPSEAERTRWLQPA